jgi:hypothetical protein
MGLVKKRLFRFRMMLYRELGEPEDDAYRFRIHLPEGAHTHA